MKLITHYRQPFQISEGFTNKILTNSERSALELVFSLVTCCSSDRKDKDMRQVFEVLHGDFLYNVIQISNDITTLCAGFILPLSINRLSCNTVKNHFQSSISLGISQTDFIRIYLAILVVNSLSIAVNCKETRTNHLEIPTHF